MFPKRWKKDGIGGVLEKFVQGGGLSTRLGPKKHLETIDFFNPGGAMPLSRVNRVCFSLWEPLEIMVYRVTEVCSKILTPLENTRGNFHWRGLKNAFYNLKLYAGWFTFH